MTSLYGISSCGIEQHITLTLPAWRCLFTVRDYMILFNTNACMRAVGVVVCLSLRMAKDRGSRRTLFIAIIVLYFLLSFHTMANISIFLSH